MTRCERSAGLTPRTPLLEGWGKWLLRTDLRTTGSAEEARKAGGRAGVHAGCLHRSRAEPVPPLPSRACVPHERWLRHRLRHPASWRPVRRAPFGLDEVRLERGCTKAKSLRRILEAGTFKNPVSELRGGTCHSN